MKRAWLGLGGNLGDPIQQIVNARMMLTQLDCVSEWWCSSMYLSSPVGYSNQPNFINCVLALDVVNVSANDLFLQTQSVENHLGRVRMSDNQNAPRKIDIDLLMFGDECIETQDLIIPHPRMGQRLFVLEPLRELGVEAEKANNTDFTQQKIHKLAL